MKANERETLERVINEWRNHLEKYVNEQKDEPRDDTAID